MIVVDQVSKYYGAHRAVTDLNFEIGDGECIGFLGLNGAGKSTTLRLLSCLLLPTSGRITVRGLDVVTHPHEIRRFIGYLPESPPVYADMTVREYLSFAGSIRGLSGKELDDRRKRVTGLCNLEDVAERPIGTLSHGYQQRVGIAQAVIHRPALLILDEPIQGLDPVQIVDMREMIGELRGEHTILLSTHILTEIEHTCDRILMMHRGRIAASGTEHELAERLTGERAIELVVRGEASALREAVASVPSASDIQVDGLEDGVCRVRLKIEDEKRDQVSRAVVEAGLGLLSMEVRTSGLESVFVQLSEGSGATSMAPPAKEPEA